MHLTLLNSGTPEALSRRRAVHEILATCGSQKKEIVSLFEDRLRADIRDALTMKADLAPWHLPREPNTP